MPYDVHGEKRVRPVSQFFPLEAIRAVAVAQVGVNLLSQSTFKSVLQERCSFSVAAQNNRSAHCRLPLTLRDETRIHC